MHSHKGGLNHKLTLLLLAVLILTSLVFLVLLTGSYRLQLQSERSQTSQEVNLLLQASLENAMLKRDLSGLQGIVDRLSDQPGVVDVAILNLNGEIRFAPQGKGVGHWFSEPIDKLCKHCESHPEDAVASTQFVSTPTGRRVLRSVNPVMNRPACSGCHAPPSEQPINGILIMDYDAESIIQKARSGLLGLIASGLLVMLATLLTVWWFMHRHVIEPLKHLTETSIQLAQGNLGARVAIPCCREFADLGTNFNLMAHRLESSLQQLLGKEAYLQSLIDAIPDAIRVIDHNYQVINANAAYRKQLDLTQTEAIHSPCYQSSHQRKTPCPHTLTRCPVYEIQQTGKPIKTMQDFINHHGQHQAVQVFAAPLEFEAQGKRKQYIVEAIRDLQSELTFSHENKLASLGELAAGVGHEIRNPLSSIRLALQSTLQRLDDKNYDPDEIGSYLKLVDGEIDQCVNVTERLLKLSSLSLGQLELVDINNAIRETLSLIQHEAQAKHIEILTTLDKGQPRMMATESDIRMLTLNLAQNAFHAMPEGGKLKVVSEVQQQQLRISFTDTGVGVSAEHRPYIFDPFYSERPDHSKGTGLGLAISRSIVERFKGKILLEDNLPHGACFIIYLPLVI
ncbi:MAG TPA: HAMP domain-containing protein [Gammaproteobacteria bacterium]|nr:HAMP domain-containing protein [Gammaproteobacteria bacterium]